MTVIIALLRGVNVGGHNKIKMEGLRTLCESLDLVRPQTHIQSGNIIFGIPQKNSAGLAKRIENAIEQTFAIRCTVVLRTLAELDDIIARNPFAARSDVPPNKLVVTFFAATPTGTLDALPPILEELHLDGRELYAYFPNGMGNSKLAQNTVDKALRLQGTARNWNTVTKLQALGQGWK
jgi:uncharacterized protein (DUF1697 family)